MPYCRYCGEWMEENHKFCTNCGAPREEDAETYEENFYADDEAEQKPVYEEVFEREVPEEDPYLNNRYNRRNPNEIPYAPDTYYEEPGYGGYPSENYNVPDNDRNGILWGILSFFFPFIGVILAIVWRKKRPQTVKMILAGIFLSVLSLLAF